MANPNKASAVLAPVGIPYHKQRKRRKFSSTPGKSKGPTCQATAQDRIFARVSRAYKDPNYETWWKRDLK